MLFSELMEAELEASMKPIMEDLLKVKMETPEVGEGKRIDAINQYIESNLAELKRIIDLQENDNNRSWDRLNELFLLGLEL